MARQNILLCPAEINVDNRPGPSIKYQDGRERFAIQRMPGVGRNAVQSADANAGMTREAYEPGVLIDACSLRLTSKCHGYLPGRNSLSIIPG